MDQTALIDELLEAWRNHHQGEMPPKEPILLKRQTTRVIYIDNGWGPPVPYPPALHDGESTNHGYQRLKGNLDAVGSIPELHGWPEYEEFIRAVNAASSPLESVGCEKSFFPFSAGPIDDAGSTRINVTLGSYTDVIFSNLLLNEDAVNHLRLAAELAKALEGCEQWWSGVELGVQRLKGLGACPSPWGLMVRVSGHGRDEEEARRTWGESIKRLGACVRRLPLAFPENLG